MKFKTGCHQIAVTYRVGVVGGARLVYTTAAILNTLVTNTNYPSIFSSWIHTVSIEIIIMSMTMPMLPDDIGMSIVDRCLQLVSVRIRGMAIGTKKIVAWVQRKYQQKSQTKMGRTNAVDNCQQASKKIIKRQQV